MTQVTTYLQLKYNHKLSRGCHVEFAVAVDMPSLYIIVVSTVSDSMSLVSMTVSEAVDGQPTAASSVAAVAVVFRSVSEWLLDPCAPRCPRFDRFLSRDGSM